MFPIHVRIVVRMVLDTLIPLALMSFFNYIDYPSLVVVRQVLAQTAARCTRAEVSAKCSKEQTRSRHISCVNVYRYVYPILYWHQTDIKIEDSETEIDSVSEAGHSREGQCKQKQLRDAEIHEVIFGLSFPKGAAAAHIGS